METTVKLVPYKHHGHGHHDNHDEHTSSHVSSDTHQPRIDIKYKRVKTGVGKRTEVVYAEDE